MSGIGMFRKSATGTGAGVGAIDPVVQSVSQTADPQLRIGDCKPRQHYTPDIGNAVTGRVFEIENIGGLGYQNSIAPVHHSVDNGHILCENSDVDVLAVHGTVNLFL